MSDVSRASKRKAATPTIAGGNDDNKQLFSSRRNAKLSVISVAAKEITSTGKESPKDIEREDEQEGKFWREKYDLLNAEQEVATKELQQLLNLSKAREMELEKHVELLQQKVKLLENTRSATESGSASELVDFYKLVTSTGVAIDKKAKTPKYTCTTTNTKTKQATQFALSYLESGELDYKPLKNAKMLPEYLQSHIVFDREMAPVMFGDILQTIFVDEE